VSEDKPRHLNEVISPFAPQGANDARWFFVEHQLVQVKFSLAAALSALHEIIAMPENEQERELAGVCHRYTSHMRRHVLDHYATLLSYLSDTDVSERISRTEV